MNAPFSKHLILKGSYKSVPAGKPVDGPVSSDLVNVTLRLRPAKPLPNLLDPAVNGSFEPLSREAFGDQYGTSKKDLGIVEDFARHEGFSLIRVEPQKRAVEIQGTITQMQKAFKVSLSNYQDAQGKVFRGREGDVSIPTELDGIVLGVFGLDTRSIASAKIRRRRSPGARAAVAAQTYYPTDVARLYNFPQGATGKGQAIAIIELDGGYNATEIDTYYKNLGLNSPTLVAVSVDGGTNNPGTTVSDSDGEVALDIEVAGTIAPDASIIVYFAGNTSKSFQDAVSAAIHDTQYKPSIISISWGGPEDTSYGSYYTTFDAEFQAAATMGITVCAAAGDSGSTDGETDGKVHVDYPASSPYVLGCGGTTLEASVQNDAISSEVVWNEPDNGGATGGGVSDIFPLPSYQSGISVPTSPNTGKVGRGVPDVAGDADPNTGYNILLGGQTEPIGGTSAVAPLMAGLLARINEQLGKSAGFIHPVLYAHPTVCRDITQGNNDTLKSGASEWAAGPGWDPCSGIGVPDGTLLLQALQG
jgi:kumamolisin